MIEQLNNNTKFHLDPRTKLLIMAFISTAEFLYTHMTFMIAIAFIPFVLLIINKQYRFGLNFIILFLIATIAKETQNFLHFNLFLNMIIVLLVGLVLRLFPAFAMGAYIIKSTSAGEFISALSRMPISKNLTIPISVIFRFLPTIKEEYTCIKDAMRMREIGLGTKKFWKNPFSLIEYKFIPLMISIVKIGDDLSAAALTRGLDNPLNRTNITEIGFSKYDISTFIISLTMLTVSFFI